MSTNKQNNHIASAASASQAGTTSLVSRRKARELDLDRRVFAGDALAGLRQLETASMHALITDPPYGLTAGFDAAETRRLVESWTSGRSFQGRSAGYRGNVWDHAVPGPELWAEALRVLKPGGYGAVFAASRTVDLTMLALRLAGFEVRDTIHWTYGSGRCASPDVGQQFAAAGQPEQAARYAGYRATLRPSHEPIVIVRKPLDAATVRANLLAHGVGALNLRALDATGQVACNTLTSHDRDCHPGACAATCPVARRDAQVKTAGVGGCPSKTLTALWPAGDAIEAQLDEMDRALYVPKPHDSRRVRDASGLKHDTEKPLPLMRALVGLLSSPGQMVLDPFLGSGTTAEAAVLEGRDFRGSEREASYLPLIDQRLRRSSPPAETAEPREPLAAA